MKRLELTCKTQTRLAAGDCCHHHVRRIKGMYKIWCESCHLLPCLDLNQEYSVWCTKLRQMWRRVIANETWFGLPFQYLVL